MSFINLSSPGEETSPEESTVESTKLEESTEIVLPTIDVRMEALKWVNSLQLTTPKITSIKELSDGKFFGDVLKMLFCKPVNTDDTTETFIVLEEFLRSQSLDMDTLHMQINFENACKGNETDLVKILIALMGLYSLTLVEDSSHEFVELQMKFQDAQKLLEVAENALLETTQKLRITEKQLCEAKIAILGMDNNNNNKTPSPLKHFISNPKLRLIPSMKNLDGGRKMKMLIFFVIMGLLLLFIPKEIVSLTIEIIFGRQEFAYIAEKYGTLEHLGPPII